MANRVVDDAPVSYGLESNGLASNGLVSVADSVELREAAFI